MEDQWGLCNAYYYISLSLKARVLPSASLFSKEGVIRIILQLLHTVRSTLHDDQGPNSVLRISVLKNSSPQQNKEFFVHRHTALTLYKIWIYLFIILSRTISSDLHYFLLNFNPLENISPWRDLAVAVRLQLFPRTKTYCGLCAAAIICLEFGTEWQTCSATSQ